MRRTTVATAAALAAVVATAWPAAAAEMDDMVWTLVELDQFEYRLGENGNALAWEGQVRIGTDEHKLALKSEGEYAVDEDAFEKAEVQALYQRPISDFFDLQLGLRHDFDPDPSRTYAVAGVNGLAPQWFEVDANLFVSDEGGVFGRFEAEHDLLLTQKLILQPSLELNVAFTDDEDLNVGAGLSSAEAGLRLRYEIEREFAPYIGVAWERSFGDTADHLRRHGEDVETFSLVGGIRAFF